jgi:hypothetical protein
MFVVCDVPFATIRWYMYVAYKLTKHGRLMHTSTIVAQTHVTFSLRITDIPFCDESHNWWIFINSVVYMYSPCVSFNSCRLMTHVCFCSLNELCEKSAPWADFINLAPKGNENIVLCMSDYLDPLDPRLEIVIFDFGLMTLRNAWQWNFLHQLRIFKIVIGYWTTSISLYPAMMAQRLERRARDHKVPCSRPATAGLNHK